LRFPHLPLAAAKMGALLREHDWSKTPLGPLETWPQSLRTTVGLVLHSVVPIVLLWGQDGTMIYNDAYSIFAGGRHPALFGSKVREGWPEVANFNDNVMKVGLAGGTLAYTDQELTLYRRGTPEQVWMNLDYSPAPDERGIPAGVIAIVVETSARVLAERGQAAERERQRAIFQQMPGFVGVLTGPDHVFEYVNDAYVTIVGPRAFVGGSVREVFPELEGLYGTKSPSLRLLAHPSGALPSDPYLRTGGGNNRRNTRCISFSALPIACDLLARNDLKIRTN
jgi:PAS domain-containing protein